MEFLSLVVAIALSQPGYGSITTDPPARQVAQRLARSERFAIMEARRRGMIAQQNLLRVSRNCTPTRRSVMRSRFGTAGFWGL